MNILKTKKEPENGWWNYRFLLKPVYENNRIIGCYYEMIEVYYDTEGKIIAWADDASNIVTESIEDLKIFMRQIKDASKRTVLEIKDGIITDTEKHMNNKTTVCIANYKDTLIEGD